MCFVLLQFDIYVLERKNLTNWWAIFFKKTLALSLISQHNLAVNKIFLKVKCHIKGGQKSDKKVPHII